MAQLLKETYDLLVLRVSIENAFKPAVFGIGRGLEKPQDCQACRTVCAGGQSKSATRNDRRMADFTNEDFGIPETIGRGKARSAGYDFRVPPTLITMIANWMASENQEGRPLWLHFQKPYGYLGLVPWERELQPVLGVPILRLPDFFQTKALTHSVH